jgi:hypothetical protein
MAKGETERDRQAPVTRSYLRQLLADVQRENDRLDVALAMPTRRTGLLRLRRRVGRAACSELDLAVAVMLGLACFVCGLYRDFVERGFL